MSLGGPYFVYFPYSGLDATMDVYSGLVTTSGDVRIEFSALRILTGRSECSTSGATSSH